MAGVANVTELKPKDVNDRHRATGLPADPLANARPVSKAARAEELRNQLKPVSLAEMFAEVLIDVKAARPVAGARTGHFRLDKYLCGLRRGNITTLGARTSFGKTSKALQIVDLNMRDQGKPLFVSCEDSRALTARRFIAMRAQVNALRLRANQCRAAEIAKMEIEAARAQAFPFFSNGIGVPVEDICDRIRQHCAEHGTGLVIVDYLQCIQTRHRIPDTRERVTHVCNSLSATIKQANAAGLLLSQMRRPQQGKEHLPTSLEELKESGDIENAAEHVLLGWVQPIKDNTGTITGKIRKIQIAKNKDGPVFDEWIDQEFNTVTASFRETRGEVYEDEDIDGRDDDYSGSFEER